MAAWTIDRIDRLVAMHVAGMTGAQIANELGGVTRNAVIGQISRLRAAGDERVPAAGEGPIISRVEAKRRDMDALAEAMAEGALSVPAAARQLGLNAARAVELWAAICARLGWQAQ